jgi:hypothetical protein
MPVRFGRSSFRQMAANRVRRQSKKAVATALLLATLVLLVLTTGQSLLPEALPLSVLHVPVDQL